MNQISEDHRTEVFRIVNLLQLYPELMQEDYPGTRLKVALMALTGKQPTEEILEAVKLVINSTKL